jgi:2-keto-4-pentenoate hydratase
LINSFSHNSVLVRFLFASGRNFDVAMKPDFTCRFYNPNPENAMTDRSRIDRIAGHLRDAHANRSQFENLSGEYALGSIDEAYQVQLALNRLWVDGVRGPIAGYKIALTSQAIRDLVGVDDPCAGAIFASTVRHSPATIAVADFVRVGLEFELAFQMGKDVPEDGSFDGESIRPYIEAAMPAFEMIEDRAADYGKLDVATLVADNAWSGGMVLGTPSTAWKKMDLETTPVSLSYNNDTEMAVTGAAMGSPLISLAYLASLLSCQGRSLKAGDIVMSGSTLATRFAKPGDHAVYSIKGLGEVEMRVE